MSRVVGSAKRLSWCARSVVVARTVTGFDGSSIGVVSSHDQVSAGDEVRGLSSHDQDMVGAALQWEIGRERESLGVRAGTVGEVIGLSRADEDVQVEHSVGVRRLTGNRQRLIAYSQRNRRRERDAWRSIGHDLRETW